MRYVIGLCVLVCACDSSKGTTQSTGAASGGTAPTAAAAATGECKPLDVCAHFPLEKVVKLCGGAIVKAVPENNDSSTQLIDSCEYQIANRASVVSIGRLCMTDKGGGAAMLGQIFQMAHDEKLRDKEVESPASGMGDKAYYRTMFNTIDLHILKGNMTYDLRSDGNSEVVKQQCLVPIATELLALP